VSVARRVVDDRRRDHPVRGAVAPEAIGDEATGQAAAALEKPTKEPRGGVTIPTRLQQDVDDVAVLINGAPEVLTLAANGHEESDSVADNRGREPVAWIARDIIGHPGTVRTVASS